MDSTQKVRPLNVGALTGLDELIFQQLTLYSYVGSQWAGVAHLGLAEKWYGNDDVEIKEIDLFDAENLEPEYLKKNPNGTVPTLTAPHLSQPLVDTRQILEFLDQSRPSGKGPDLASAGAQDRAAVNTLIELVHSDNLETGLIIFGCLNEGDLQRLQASPLTAYLTARQTALERYHSADPTNAFYGAKLTENSALYNIFTGSSNADRDAFFADTEAKIKTFATGLEMLERQIRLPYAIGDHVTLADVHMVPWLSHILFTLGTTDPSDFSKLEGRMQQAVPNFKLGPKISQWWNNFRRRDSFQQVFKTLH